MSLKVQALLSLHGVPGVPDQLVGLLPGWQIWQGLLGLLALDAVQTLSMKHQPGCSSGLHWPSAGSHAAVWHSLGPAQLTGVLAQLPLARSQVSVVHRLPSSQSPSLLQQPGTLTSRHLPCSGSQVGASQAPRTGQSLFCLQQPAN